MRRCTIGLMCLLLAWSGAAPAADEKGRFGIKGVGGVACSHYLQAFEAKDQAYLMYLGWFGGYLTGANQRLEATFDLTPWQNVGLVSYAVAEVCRRSPKASVLQAVQRVIQGVWSQRLTQASPMVPAKGERAEVEIYQAVLIQVQRALEGAGFYAGDIHGRYDAATRAALERFQEAKRLTVTGLPDQRTLLVLFNTRGGASEGGND